MLSDDDIQRVAVQCDMKIGQHWNRDRMNTSKMRAFARAIEREARRQALEDAAQPDAVEALQKVSSEHDIGYAAGWRNCADEATRIVASHIDRLEPGRQPRTRDALLDLLASMRSILVVQRAVLAAPQPPSAQADAVEALRWEKPGPVSPSHPLECLVVLSALRQSDGDWWIDGSIFLADDLPIAWAPDTPEARAVLAWQGGER